MSDFGADFDSLSPPTKAGVRSWGALLSLWNWKSAVLSVALRVPVFAAVTFRRGLEAITGAVLAEVLVCAVYAGSYAAVVQAIRNRRPVWLTAILITSVLPAVGQLIEYAVHTWRATPHRILAVIVSSIPGVISSLFNWYAMRHSTLLVGNERSPFFSDLRRFPLLLGCFLLLGPRWLLQRVGRRALANRLATHKSIRKHQGRPV